MTIGERIKMYREQANMTQEELARRVNVTSATIARNESGEIKNIPAERVYKIAQSLNVYAGVLHGWDKDGYIIESKKIAESNSLLSDIYECLNVLPDDKLEEVRNYLYRQMLEVLKSGK